ncbi:MAG: sugar ABC transporter substrate-binding protein [Actinobacteria bacterium]|nr:sugar ABC transporter substrate-binding protein [Bacillota bacterium]MCL5045229.1 sugar ABC transporter substrate-binding protein [Actinomycetota bacterium]
MSRLRLRPAVVCVVLVLLLMAILSGCSSKTKSEPAPQANTSTPEAKPFSPEGKTLLWVQPLKGHPVHQLTQIAFAEGAKKLGYKFEIIGTEQWDVQSTIALVEAAMAKGAAGMVVWAGEPSFYPFIEKVSKNGISVFVPHFPIPEGTVPGLKGIVSADPADYAKEVAIEIGKAINGKGTVAITQGSFNTTENLVSETFKKTMNEKYPNVKVLPPQEEGFDPPKAIAKAVAILQANPDIVAALSTTGGGPTTWAGAQKDTGKKIVAVGMDYTRVNLDLVKNGEIFAVVGQPLWEESYAAAELLDKTLRGEKPPYWTKLSAPFITKDKLAPYYSMLEKVEAAIKK